MTHRLALAAALLCTTGLTTAHADVFNRISSFEVTANLPEGTDISTETSPEIIAASEDGMTLIYTDSPLGAVGLIDITDPSDPQPGGAIML
ncbi:MAG: alkaline phosphatase, partial [Pseudomonadota bacterium]